MRRILAYTRWLVWILFLAAGAHGKADVRITEYMSLNHTTLADEDGDYSDWIELYNSGPDAVDLGDWHLTDDAASLTRWSFPSTNLDAGNYLVVFASGKNRSKAGGQLHTNFKLDAGGEYLALVQPDGARIACAYAPQFPPQRADVSFGLDPASAERLFFSHPTPGAPNDMTSAGVAETPVFSLPGGVYTNNSLTLRLSASSSNAVIRYTLNGTDPTAGSPVYFLPLTFGITTVVRARVFVDGLQPSPIVSADYRLLAGDVASFSSNLPLVIVNTFGHGIPDGTKITASTTFIDTLGGRCTLTNAPDYDGLGGITLHGSSSLQFPKKSYSLELRDQTGQPQDAPILGFPADSDWVLYAPYTDKTLMRNVLAYELHGRMGHYAVRTRFVELFLHLFGGKLAQRDYAGVYVVMEKIKRGKNRVDIAKLGPEDNAEPNVTGGYIIKKDRLDPGDSGFSTPHAGVLAYVDPKESEITPAQKAWLSQWFATFESALYGPGFRNPATGYAAYIDVPSFIDNYWIVEMSRNIDGFCLSNYMHKDRLGKLVMDPIWDWNLAFGNANYGDAWETAGWYQPGGTAYPWFPRLFQDVDFNQAVIDRWAQLRHGLFDTSALLARVDQLAAFLNEAQIRNYQRWPGVLGHYIWPNWYIGKTYQDEIGWMKQWITNRLAWIDSQFLPAPALTSQGGQVSLGFALGMSAPKGTIRYTLDGADPRLSGGFISPHARLYSSPVHLTNNARVFARALSGSTWSAPTMATFVVKPVPLRITEVMYHPATPDTSSLYSGEDFEFVELKNIGPAKLDLAGIHFTDGIEFSFSGSAVTNLGPGQYVLVVKNLAAFASRYGLMANIAGEYTGSLDNAGEHLAIAGPLGEPIQDFSYNPTWHPATDGLGYSLVAVDEQSGVADSSFATHWRPSALPGGSPGVPDPVPLVKPIWVSELLANPASGQPAFVELYNPNQTAVDVSHWLLTTDRTKPHGYEIPVPSILPPGGCLVFTARAWAPAGTPPKHFQPSHDGGEIYLYSADASGSLTGYGDGFQYGASDPGVSFGRYVTAGGQALFLPQAAATPNQSNAGPRVPRVIINEIRYHPALGDEEFIELKNTTATPIKLYDPGAPTNYWELSGAGFRFPPGAQIPPHGFVLLAGSAPSAFRLKYGIPASTPVFELYPNVLQNSGKSLALRRPGPPEVDPKNGAVVVPYIDEDVVHYDDKAPWPVAADGQGPSLERVAAKGCGDDPGNWQASSGTGSPGRENGESFQTWQSRHFSSTELSDPDISGPQADPDHDGQSNYAEYVSGTNPRDAASFLRVDGVALKTNPTAAIITFSGAARHAYTLQWREASLSGPWQNLTNIPPLLEDGPAPCPVPIMNNAACYYRVATPWQEP